MRGGDGRPTVGWITSDKIKLYFAGKNAKDASIWIRQEDKETDWHVVFHALKGVGYNPTTMEPLDDHWSMHESKEDAEAHYERVQDLRNFHSGGYARITEGSDW